MKRKEMVEYLNESDVVRLMKMGHRFSSVLDLSLTDAIEKLLSLEIHNGVSRGTYVEYMIHGYAKNYDEALKTTMKLLHKAKKMDDALGNW